MREHVTIQASTPKLNEVSIWVKVAGIADLDIRPYRGLYNFQEKGLIRQAGKTSVYRYAKNYKKGKTEFSLLLLTKDNNAAKVHLFLDETAKSIKQPKPERTVSYTGKIYE